MFILKSGKANNNLESAIVRANAIVKNRSFIIKILEKQNFDMATCDSSVIAKDLENFSEYVCIKIYRPRWPWSKAYGYFSKSRPFDINLNSRKLNRSSDSLLGTLIHELIHMLDHQNIDHYYGHGDNSPNGKQNTAPYFIGNLAANGDFNNNESYKMK